MGMYAVTFNEDPDMMTNDFDLNAVDVAKPCTEDWSRMRGDKRAKHCAKCEKTRPSAHWISCWRF
jgi:hypothetical protein